MTFVPCAYYKENYGPSYRVTKKITSWRKDNDACGAEASFQGSTKEEDPSKEARTQEGVTMAIHPSYLCQCQTPTPLVFKTQDTGLCTACNGIYDERLYEMRLREHVAGLEGETLEDHLIQLDPKYRQLIGAS